LIAALRVAGTKPDARAGREGKGVGGKGIPAPPLLSPLLSACFAGEPPIFRKEKKVNALAPPFPCAHLKLNSLKFSLHYENNFVS